MMPHRRSVAGKRRQSERAKERRTIFLEAYMDDEIDETVSQKYYYLNDVLAGEVLLDSLHRGSMQRPDHPQIPEVFINQRARYPLLQGF
jgi:hypothetical protein